MLYQLLVDTLYVVLYGYDVRLLEKTPLRDFQVCAL